MVVVPESIVAHNALPVLFSPALRAGAQHADSIALDPVRAAFHSRNGDGPPWYRKGQTSCGDDLFEVQEGIRSSAGARSSGRRKSDPVGTAELEKGRLRRKILERSHEWESSRSYDPRLTPGLRGA